MGTVKITSWNVEHLDRLTKPNLSVNQQKRRDAVVQEIQDLSPDILLLLEGPEGEGGIDKVSNELLGGDWVPVKASDAEYATKGNQWIWFLVRKNLANKTSLLPIATWDAFAEESWKCNFWGEFDGKVHRHYRHPQVLVFDWNGLRVEFIGLHLKSKFVNGGKSMWNAGGEERKEFIRGALTARIKLTTEATNVRKYIDKKFEQVEKPAIFVMGDLNDGPGKEYFEERFLFFDLISNIQGDVFFATRFLNHALFDFPDELRWTVDFEDFVKGGDIAERDPHILLDHIMFTQGLVDGSLSWKINEHAGMVEHEVHDLINAPLPGQAKTSDHKPVSVTVTTED
jgi:endonuclease/exonuclease/phosphatase family metal-dependent hydrolase